MFLVPPQVHLWGGGGGGGGRCTFGGGDRVSIRFLRHVNLVYISRGLVGRGAATKNAFHFLLYIGGVRAPP